MTLHLNPLIGRWCEFESSVTPQFVCNLTVWRQLDVFLPNGTMCIMTWALYEYILMGFRAHVLMYIVLFGRNASNYSHMNALYCCRRVGPIPYSFDIVDRNKSWSHQDFGQYLKATQFMKTENDVKLQHFRQYLVARYIFCILTATFT